MNIRYRLTLINEVQPVSAPGACKYLCRSLIAAKVTSNLINRSQACTACNANQVGIRRLALRIRVRRRVHVPGNKGIGLYTRIAPTAAHHQVTIGSNVGCYRQ